MARHRGENAKSKSFDPNVFASLRLAPDQFPLARQVQICCDSVKLAASFLSGKPAESQPDTEQTLEELQARVRSIIAYLDGFTAARLQRRRHARREPAALERRMDDGRGLLRPARAA